MLYDYVEFISQKHTQILTCSREDNHMYVSIAMSFPHFFVPH